MDKKYLEKVHTNWREVSTYGKHDSKQMDTIHPSPNWDFWLKLQFKCPWQMHLGAISQLLRIWGTLPRSRMVVMFSSNHIAIIGPLELDSLEVRLDERLTIIISKSFHVPFYWMRIEQGSRASEHGLGSKAWSEATVQNVKLCACQPCLLDPLSPHSAI